jgi:hypothetical protein
MDLKGFGFGVSGIFDEKIHNDMKKSLLVLFLLPVSVAILAQNNDIKPTENVKYLDEMPAWLKAKTSNGYYGKRPINEIKSYMYKGELVYLLSLDVPCCDFYSAVLFDKKGKVLGQPFGGISGRGDMKIPDFGITKSNEKLLWAKQVLVKPLVNDQN